MQENDAYILGTDQEELDRLKIQHQVWKSETERGWKLANFKSGNILLDLGCGPGYCTIELANIVGKNGKVIGVDRSASFINYLEKIKENKKLPIDSKLSTFDELNLGSNSLDGIYCRWALAWIPNPKEILNKLKTYLKPSGIMVIHEYYFWTSHRTQPQKPNLKKNLYELGHSFDYWFGESDVNSLIPDMLKSLIEEVRELRIQ